MESTTSEDPILLSNNMMITEHRVASLTVDSAIINNSSKATGNSVVTHPIIPTNSAIVQDSTISTESVVTRDCLVPTDSVITINPFDSSICADQLVTTNHLVATNGLVSTDSTVPIDENVLTSITAEGLTIDTISLLQQFQPSRMVVSAENDSESIPLILNDVTFLNLESAEDHMPIISLSELDPAINDTRVRKYRNFVI